MPAAAGERPEIRVAGGLASLLPVEQRRSALPGAVVAGGPVSIIPGKPLTQRTGRSHFFLFYHNLTELVLASKTTSVSPCARMEGPWCRLSEMESTPTKLAKP